MIEIAQFKKGNVPHNFIDITGLRFGRLVAIEHLGKQHWKCKCDCGNITISNSYLMRNGKAKSCGCLVSEINRDMHYIDGRCETRLYHTYLSMKARCFNPHIKRFENYGGRGITVCDEWKNSYSSFREWAISNGYKDCLTLDRIDVNGNYEPNNCRWATRKEQSNNKRNNILVTVDGITETLKQTCERYKVPYKRTWKRFKCGWSIEDALFKPPRNC